MDSSETTDHYEVVSTLVHELRQPLSAIGLSAAYLGLLTPECDSRVLQQILAIQQQLEHVTELLNQAAARVRHGHVQQDPCAANSLDDTKSRTAPLT